MDETSLVRTNNNSLRSVTTTAKLDNVGYRWLAELANYTCKIEYRQGQLNKDVDALSRLPEKSSLQVDGEVVSALLDGSRLSPGLGETVLLQSVLTDPKPISTQTPACGSCATEHGET